MSINSHIGVKRMGELDNKPFHDAMKRKYNEAEADERASELCSLWEEYLRDPGWHPLKVVMTNGKEQVCRLAHADQILPYCIAFILFLIMVLCL